jgi:ferric-dicitrate binding protein FerR (iron transport regulator)
MIFVFSNFTRAAAASADVSCECEQSSCGPCETEVGTSFYSAKCGPSNMRVKSCKKPTCEAFENQKQCLADLNAKKSGSKNASQTEVVESRAPASAKKRAGTFEELTGDVKVAHGGHVLPATKDAVVFEGDTIETGLGGKTRIKLDDGSKLMVASSSQVQIDLIDSDLTAKKRRIAMSLLYGKIRNKVDKRSDGENVFEVKTRTAVAGVRGTDFASG